MHSTHGGFPCHPHSASQQQIYRRAPPLTVLPRLRNLFVDPGNSFNILDEINDVDTEGYVPDYLNQDRIEGRFQQRYELMLKRREVTEVYHTSHGHCNNRQTVLNLQAKGIECNHLKRYILAHKCDACDAAPGRRHCKVRATTKAKRKAKSASNTIAPLPATVAACEVTVPFGS